MPLRLRQRRHPDLRQRRRPDLKKIRTSTILF
jgi:hypothetical protein